VPSDFTKVSILVLRPLMAEEMRMTVAMPMEMPRTVRPERSLFLRRVSSAIFTDSFESLRLMV
jgi:hypothetical protein